MEYSFVFLRSICFCVAMYANNSLESHILLPYFLLKSFIRIYIETWNLSFCFQHCLFNLKSVIARLLLQYLDFFFFFFLIYEINAVVSIHSNAFYPATSALKVLYVNFSGQDLLRFACCVSFLFINVFLTNLLTFYDFLLLLYIMFFLSTNMAKTDMKKIPK